MTLRIPGDAQKVLFIWGGLFCIYVFDTIVGSQLKYWLLALGIICFFWAEHIDKSINKKYWLVARYLGLSALIGGVLITFDDDRESSVKSALLFKKVDQQGREQKYLFDQSLERLENVSKKMSSFQKRQQNPLPDSLFLNFSLVFDISKSPLGVKMLTKAKNNTSTDINGEQFEQIDKRQLTDSLTDIDIRAIRDYWDEVSEELLIRFSKDGDTITYYVNYFDHSPNYSADPTFYFYKRDKIKCVYGYEQNIDPGNRPNLKMSKFVPGSFISILDFKDADVQIIFGRPVYDRADFKIKSKNIKVSLENIKVRFGAIADYAKIGKISQSKANHLVFNGTVTEWRQVSKSATTTWFQ